MIQDVQSFLKPMQSILLHYAFERYVRERILNRNTRYKLHNRTQSSLMYEQNNFETFRFPFAPLTYFVSEVHS